MSFNTINKHDRDGGVTFEEETHTYSIQGTSDGVTSVTTLIETYFPKFDADAVLAKFWNRWQQNSYNKYFGKSKDEIKEMWEKERDTAATLGTNLHGAIEKYYLEDHDIDEDTTNRKEWSYFLKFQDKYKLNVTQTLSY